MRISLRLGIVTGIALAAAATSALPAAAAAHNDAAAAVFVQTDDPSGNAIVAFDRSAGGQLHRAGTYATGGTGGELDGSVVDHLASQGSIAYDRAANLLYVVNAGSNSITVFGVHGDHLTRHQVIGSGGTFPVSITVHGNLLYVLNARAGGSIQGYLRVGGGLVRIGGWHRQLGLDATLTPEFTHTPGQIAFTPDGSKLVVTTKANGNDIDVFALHRFAGPAATPVVTLEDGAVPFAVSFDRGGHLVVAEAGTNALATFTIHGNGTVTPIALAATGQAATCWVASDGSRFYASNAGSADVSGYRDHGSGSLTALGTTGTDAGTVDAAVTSDGRYLYVETGASGILDEFRVAGNGALTAMGSVTVPDAVGAEGIAAS